MAGNGDGFVALLFQIVGDLFTGIGLAAGDDNFGTQASHFFGDGTADAFSGTGDQGNFSGHIKKRIYHHSILIH